MRSLHCNNHSRIADAIRRRLRDHGWRERDLLRGVLREIGSVTGKEEEVKANCDNLYYEHLVPSLRLWHKLEASGLNNKWRPEFLLCNVRNSAFDQ